MDFAADHNPLLADFGVTAMVGGMAVLGVFEDPYDQDLGLSGSRPTLLVRDADAVAVGDTLSVNDTAYLVRALQPDGQGMTRLVLVKA